MSKDPEQQKPRRVGGRRLWRWLRNAVLGAIAMLLLLAAAGATYQSVATARDARRFSPPGEMVDVGGFRLHLNCSGEGAPVVIMDSPSGSSSLGWSRVQPEVARFTRVCAYDRAGYGWSDPGPNPRTSERIVSELRSLLASAGLEGPYVLVGSSVGGCNLRLLAGQAPNEVAGMVLVDSAHEEMFSRLPPSAGISSGQIRIVGLMRLAARLGILRLAEMPIGEGSADVLPEELIPMARAVGFRSSWIDAIYQELAATEESFAQVREALPRNGGPLLGEKPLVVLTRGRQEEASGEEALAQEIWMDLQKELAAGSTNSTQIIATQSGHFIQADQPGLVVEAIRKVTEEVRLRRAGDGEGDWNSPPEPL